MSRRYLPVTTIDHTVIGRCRGVIVSFHRVNAARYVVIRRNDHVIGLRRHAIAENHHATGGNRRVTPARRRTMGRFHDVKSADHATTPRNHGEIDLGLRMTAPGGRLKPALHGGCGGRSAREHVLLLKVATAVSRVPPVEPFHLFRHIDEQALPYTNGKDMNEAAGSLQP
jgi:hypothetical protein